MSTRIHLVSTRIYVVTSTAEGEPARLVKAGSQAHAIRHVASKYSAEVASQQQLVEQLSAGVKVESAANE